MLDDLPQPLAVAESQNMVIFHKSLILGHEFGSKVQKKIFKTITFYLQTFECPVHIFDIGSKTHLLDGQQLIYSTSSSYICFFVFVSGSLGTAGRVCNKSSKGMDGCEVMCCGRGYDTTRVKRVTKCECRFKWCCSVECQDCEDTVDVHTCKPHKRPDWLDLT